MIFLSLIHFYLFKKKNRRIGTTYIHFRLKKMKKKKLKIFCRIFMCFIIRFSIYLFYGFFYLEIFKRKYHFIEKMEKQIFIIIIWILEYSILIKKLMLYMKFLWWHFYVFYLSKREILVLGKLSYFVIWL